MGNEVQMKDKGQEVVVFETLEQLQEAVKNDKNLLREFYKDQEAFIKKHINGSEKQEEPVKKDPQGHEDSEEEVKIKINKKILGSYLYDKDDKPLRTVEEAIKEIIKGKKESDIHIDFLKNETIPSLEKKANEMVAANQALQIQLQNLQAKLSTPPKKEEKPIPKIDVEKELSDINLLDEDAGAKIKKIFTDLASINLSLQERVANAEAKLEDIPKIVQEGISKNIPQKDNSNIELEEIDRFKNRYSEEFGTKRKIKEIESDFISFSKDLAVAAGVKKILDENGQWSSDIQKAFEDYSNENSERGKELRSKLDSAGISLPDDYGAFTAITDIKEIRDSYARPDGSNPMSFDDAYLIYKKNKGLLDKEKVELLKSKKEREERAIDKRKGFAKETPTHADQGAEDIESMSIQSFERLVNKAIIEGRQRTPEEIALLTKIAKHKGISDEVIARLIK